MEFRQVRMYIGQKGVYHVQVGGRAICTGLIRQAKNAVWHREEQYLFLYLTYTFFSFIRGEGGSPIVYFTSRLTTPPMLSYSQFRAYSLEYTTENYSTLLHHKSKICFASELR